MNDVKKLPKFFFVFSSNVLLVVKYSFFKIFKDYGCMHLKRQVLTEIVKQYFFIVALLFPTV